MPHSSPSFRCQKRTELLCQNVRARSNVIFFSFPFRSTRDAKNCNFLNCEFHLRRVSTVHFHPFAVECVRDISYQCGRSWVRHTIESRTSIYSFSAADDLQRDTNAFEVATDFSCARNQISFPRWSSQFVLAVTFGRMQVWLCRANTSPTCAIVLLVLISADLGLDICRRRITFKAKEKWFRHDATGNSLSLSSVFMEIDRRQCAVRMHLQMPAPDSMCATLVPVKCGLRCLLFRPCHRLFTIYSSWFCGTATTPNANAAGSVKPSKWNRNSFFRCSLSICFCWFSTCVVFRSVTCDEIGTSFTFASILLYIYQKQFSDCLCVGGNDDRRLLRWYKEKSMFVFQRNFEVEIGRRYH